MIKRPIPTRLSRGPHSASLLRSSLYAIGLAFCLTSLSARTPAVGDVAPDFTLQTLAGQSVRLGGLNSAEHIVIVVLRGWPGYQCPFCNLQVYEYVEHAAEFAAQHTQIVVIYPGPAEALQAHAEEFLKDKRWPGDFHFLIDPGYEFTNRYELRWTGKNETAYPSTFVLDRNRKVVFAHVSHEHGDRISAAAVLRFLTSSAPTKHD